MIEQLDELSDDDTRAEFARLRESALREIQAPGAIAAHRTVRSRRHLHAATASAGLAVVAFAGSIAFAFSPPAQKSNPAAPPAARFDALGSVVETRNTLPTLGALYGIGRDQGDGQMFTVFQPAKPGLYRFVVACSGSGTGTVTLFAGQEKATAPVTCGVPPVTSPVELNVTEQAAELWVSIDWDPGAKLQNMPDGWAIEIVGPRLAPESD